MTASGLPKPPMMPQMLGLLMNQVRSQLGIDLVATMPCG